MNLWRVCRESAETVACLQIGCRGAIEALLSREEVFEVGRFDGETKRQNLDFCYIVYSNK